jgi:hypothetical protein
MGTAWELEGNTILGIDPKGKEKKNPPHGLILPL